MDLIRLTDLRKSKRWSIQYTADRLGIAKSTYAGYESGYREPSLEAIRMLADLFDTSVDYLLGRVNERASKAQETVQEAMELLHAGRDGICVDGKTLSATEIKHLVAFVRALREMEEE